jgi:hypothetical protein
VDRRVVTAVTLALATLGCSDERRDAREWAGPAPGERSELARTIDATVVFVRRDTADGAPRVEVLLRIPPRQERNNIRATLLKAVSDVRRDDSTVAAVRATAVVATSLGRDSLALLPVAQADWAPEDGWAGVTARNAREFHRITFYYFDAPSPGPNRP